MYVHEVINELLIFPENLAGESSTHATLTKFGNRQQTPNRCDFFPMMPKAPKPSS